jgi:N-acetylglutamate synthase-like GNAT family acetyltransferase
MEEPIAIRNATQADAQTIKRIIRAAGLDPMSLHSPNFLVAERDGRVVGIGQVKPYRGARELGSLAVLKSHQGHGIGSAIVRALIARETGDLFLFCREPLESYYAQFGFRRIGLRETRGTVRTKYLFSRPFRLFGVNVIAMKREATAAGTTRRRR